MEKYMQVILIKILQIDQVKKETVPQLGQFDFVSSFR